MKNIDVDKFSVEYLKHGVGAFFKPYYMRIYFVGGKYAIYLKLHGTPIKIECSTPTAIDEAIGMLILGTLFEDSRLRKDILCRTMSGQDLLIPG